MSTTIDSLQIEIQSNSTNAAASIDKLAKALKKLSKNSDINAAVSSLNDLRKSLHAFVNMPSNASKIESLANSMSRLKKVGKIDLGNSLTSIKRSMESLGAINVDGVAPQIERIANALKPLNNVKGGGFNSTINGLKKLDDVVDNLDSGSIDRFVAKIKELDEKLSPVSKKLVAIGNAFKGVNTTSVAAGKGVGTFNTKISASLMNLSNFGNVVRDIRDALQPVIDLISKAISKAIEWEGIAGRFGRGFGDQADEVYSKIQQLNKGMGLNTQQFMQYSSVYATMLRGYGVAIEDAQKMALGYTELTYDIWAGYNDIYKSFDDAATAVRAAIAGETEPVQKAGFDVRDTALEQAAALKELNYSTQNTTNTQKTYLRYQAMVNQAMDQDLVGVYADELDTAEGMMRTFNQQVETLSQTFGSVFLPILVEVMPWLTAFVELLGDAIRAVAGVFGVEIQKFDTEEFKGLGNIAGDADAATGSINDTTKALKDLKKATLGIDELNIISPQTNSGSGNSGSGSGGGWDRFDVNSIWDESIYNKINEQVEDIKERIKGLIPVISGIGAAFAGWSLLKFLDNIDDVGIKLGKLEPTVKNLAKGLVIAGISIAVGKLVWDFTGAYLESGSMGDLAKILGTTVIGTAVAAWLTGAKGAGIVLATSGVVSLTKLAVDLNNGTVEISDPQAITTAIVGSIETIIGGAITWKVLGPKISAAFKSLFGTASLKSIGTTISGALSSGWTAITGALAAVPVWGWIAAAVVALVGGAIGIAVADYDFTDAGRKIGEAFGKAVRKIVDFGTPIKEAISNAIKWVADTFEIDSIGELLNVIFNPREWITRVAPKLLEIGLEILPGIAEGIKKGWKNFKENIKEFCDGIIQGFKDGFEIRSPSKKMIAVGKEILAGLLEPLTPSEIRDKVKEMWNKAKEWWNGKSGLEKANVDVSLVKKGWTSFKAWIGNIPTVSQAVSLVKSGWTSVKNWIGSIPTCSAGIKLAKSGWSSIKSWLGSLDFKLNFKLPKIGINWGTKEVLGFKISYPSGFYTYAQGGFPDIGELFVAREAGPEMVGKIGNKNAVVNNQQIVEAVSEGVYSAVLSAMRQSEGNGGQAVNVYLDGRQITSSVERHQRERGATIMRNGVYAY